MKETLTETIKEPKPQADTLESKVEDTEKESKVEGAETKSGETVEPEYVRGIDISNIPEADRPRIKELLEEKLALVDKGNQEVREKLNKEKESLQELIQTRDYLTSRGITTAEVNTTFDNLIRNKTNPQEKTNKVLDKLIAEAPVEQRASLEQFRTIVKEETNVGELKKEIETLKDSLNVISQSSAANVQTRLNNELTQLSSYGELIDKYRNKILAFSSNPQARGVSAENLLFMVASPEELKKVLSTKSRVNEKKQAVSNPPSGVNAKETIDVSKHKKYGSLFRELMGKNK